MKLLVCISKTPETTSKISFIDGKTFNAEGVQFIMNPYDEWYALVRALELVEANGGSVTVINVGPPANDIVIRKALAIGANDAVRIDAEAESAFQVATYIANYAKEQGYDIILTGKETIDYNGSEVGGMIAELINQPFISYASKLEVAGQTATIQRDIEGGIESLEVNTPFVLSAAKGLAEQRIPNMRGIMMAKKKPLTVVNPEVVESNVKITSFQLPPEKTGVKLIDPDNIDELVRLLHEEAKVI